MSIIDYSVTYITVSSDMVEAVRLITKVDFYTTQCLPRHQAKTVARKLRNFIKVRQPVEYTKFMQYYELTSIANTSDKLLDFADLLTDSDNEGCAVVISIGA